MNADIACHSGFCVFQPVRKKYSTISAKTNTSGILAKITKSANRIAGKVSMEATYAKASLRASFSTSSFVLARV